MWQQHKQTWRPPFSKNLGQWMLSANLVVYYFIYVTNLLITYSKSCGVPFFRRCRSGFWFEYHFLILWFNHGTVMWSFMHCSIFFLFCLLKWNVVYYLCSFFLESVDFHYAIHMIYFFFFFQETLNERAKIQNCVSSIWYLRKGNSEEPLMLSAVLYFNY